LARSILPLVSNYRLQRRGITALQRKPAVPVHRQKRQLSAYYDAATQ
jgi:hypothetical protein